MLTVAIPTLSPDSIAHRALTAEGVLHKEYILIGDPSYADLMEALWEQGEGFIVVEDDVVPWYGAIQQLSECRRDWCVFRYPDGGTLSRGLGCTKFSTRLVREYPNLSDEWRSVDWHEIDNAVCAAVARVLRAENPEVKPRCTHEPPVAHAKRVV